ncbi:MAG: hypothetical protein PHN88_09345 [Ignavibacteria bacterium]|nr:hypothetical protein [Ignavibacteria bacterium]
MKKKILLFLIIGFLAYLNAYSQSKFEDAVALNFKNNIVSLAGYFDNDNNLVTARQIAKDGSYYLEIGKYDDNGSYTVKKILELNNDPSEVKVKFNSDGSKAGVLELSPDRAVLSYVDMNSGTILQDFKLESAKDFFLIPDGRYIVVTDITGSVLLDLGEGDPILSYAGETALDLSADGNTLFCKNGSSIDYIDTKTGKKLRAFQFKDYKTVDFDDRGEIILSLTNSGIKVIKLTQENIVTLKEIDGSIMPVASSMFDYFVIDNAGMRGVYNLGGNLVYKSRIDSYNLSKTVFVFGKEDKRMALLSDKGVYVYDFEMIKYYNKLAQKYPDLFMQKVQFENDQDQENRASRVKFQKSSMVANVADEMKVSEGLIKQNQKNSLGLVELKISAIGYYNPTTEMYDVTLSVPVDYLTNKDVSTKVKVPKFQAEIFSKNYQNFKVFALRQLNRDQTGVDVFDINIVNDLNNTNYRCLMHRTLPPNKLSYNDMFAAGQKFFEMRNWYETLLNLSDFPEDFTKNSVVDFMLNQSVTSFFDEKWSYVMTLNPIKDSTQLLIYLSDFPKTFKQIDEVNSLRQRVVNNIMETRLDRLNQYISDKMYLDGIDYMKLITPSYYDPYSGKDIEYEYYKSKFIPVKNNLLIIVAKRAMDGTNWSMAVELLNQVTKDYPDYPEVEKLLNDAKSQMK